MSMQPGDLVCVRSKTGLAGRLIRLGAALQDRPNLQNHVAVHTHDKDGIPWGVEGKPGGVGWVDMRRYLADAQTLTNIGQPKTAAQRQLVTAVCTALVGTPYDWPAIAADAAAAIGMAGLLSDRHPGLVPGHVVCSSLAAWAYDKAGLLAPKPPPEWRTVTPADWTALLLEHRWNLT